MRKFLLAICFVFSSVISSSFVIASGIPCGAWSFLSAGRVAGFKTLYGPGVYRWTYFTSTGCMDSDYVNVP